MTDTPDNMNGEDTVSGGGPSVAEQYANDPVNRAATQLQLLSEEAREAVLAKMDPQIAEQIRMKVASLPEPSDIAGRRQMLREMANRVSERKVVATDRVVEATVTAEAQPSRPAPQAPGASPMLTGQPAAPVAPADPLDALRTLHPAAIARAMQGERAEAWAIVLDRLDNNAKAALQLYLDGTARTAIEDARRRQLELAETSPALLATIESAIARTVVPRAMREHHQLLSTTPLAFTGVSA